MLGFEAYEPTGLYQYSTAYTLMCLEIDLSAGIPNMNLKV